MQATLDKCTLQTTDGRISLWNETNACICNIIDVYIILYLADKVWVQINVQFLEIEIIPF